jgi:starvation-inducible outer membrane lipoprotein
MTMRINNTIAAIAAITGLALAGCNSKPKDTNGKQEGDSPDFSDVKKETAEALKTTGEFIETKAGEGGKVIVAAGENAGEAVKESIDDLQGQAKDEKAAEPDPKPTDRSD